MNLQEYQSKRIFAKFGVPIPRGEVATTATAARDIARRLGTRVVIKSQVLVGGRGKAGGIKLASTPDEAEMVADKILGMDIKGLKVRKVLVDEAADIKKELYLGLVIDRAQRRVVMMGSSEGGVDIEEVAARTPEKITKIAIDPFLGLKDYQAREMAMTMGVNRELVGDFIRIAQALYAAFMQSDASLAEINPLAVIGEGKLVGLDGKMSVDDNALFRHLDLDEMRDVDEEDPYEAEARRFGLSYVKLDGEIGCMVNGAGLAMATMDMIKHAGGNPANFLDVGGGATAEKVTEAFKIMLKNDKVKGILVNIFGGIMKCDTIADGVIAACKAVNLSVPLVVRMKGTNEELGKKMLAESGLPIIAADTMAEAATKIVKAVA